MHFTLVIVWPIIYIKKTDHFHEMENRIFISKLDMLNNKADARFRDMAQEGMSEWLSVYVCLGGFVG